MDTLVNILLSLNAILPNGHYTTADINNYAAAYSSQISIIQNTPSELAPIMVEFEPESLIIIDNLGG